MSAAAQQLVPFGHGLRSKLAEKQAIREGVATQLYPTKQKRLMGRRRVRI